MHYCTAYGDKMYTLHEKTLTSYKSKRGFILSIKYYEFIFESSPCGRPPGSDCRDGFNSFMQLYKKIWLPQPPEQW